jgi:hypothetical protein
MFLPSSHSSPDQALIEASHEPLGKLDHILVPPSESTDNYQQVRPFVAQRKYINTSLLTKGEYSIPGNLHGAFTLHYHNSSKSQAFLLTS